MMEMLKAAQEYAAQGLCIFPLKPNAKTPLTAHGHLDATTNIDKIRAWWMDEPNANIGLVIGDDAGIIVLDIDSVKGHGIDGFAAFETLQKAHGIIQDTYAVKTATGGGHYYFEYPKALKVSLIKRELAKGVEVKYKGYVVAPPSIVNGIAYEITKSGEVGRMSPEWVKTCAKDEPSREDWERIRPRGSGPSICEEHGISMGDVLTLPGNARKVSDGFLIEHPIHGATGDGNMFVNTSLNLWCCYRHDTGGDPLTWIAVREGFITCEDAGSLDVETVLRCKDIMRRDGMIQENTKEPAPVLTDENNAAECESSMLDDAVTSAWFDGAMSSVTIYVNGKPVIKKLPEIKPVVVVDGPQTINELLDVFHSHLYFEEDYNVTAPVCAFLSDFTAQDPGIYGIIGPSGSIKTEMIRSFGEVQNQFCYPISSITENTLISGMEKNIDTIPLLRGRVLTIKDLTTVLSKNEDIRAAIFADFREVNDGYIHKEYGNGVKKEYHDIHSTILFAATPAIERYYSMYAELGTRMLFMRPQNDPIKARIKSRQNQQAGMKAIRKTLQDSMLSFVNACINRLMNEPLPAIPADIEDEIGRYCDLLAWLRHPLHHDYKGNVDDIAPDPEFPTRLMNSISLLTLIHAFIHQRTIIDKEHDLEFARRIVADNVLTNRAAIITHLSDEWQSLSILSQDSGINTRSLTRPLDELTILGIANKKSREDALENGLDGRSSHFRLTAEWSQSLQSLYSVIRVGGRIREKIKETNNEGYTLTPDHTIQKKHDHSELVRIIRETILASAIGTDGIKTRAFFLSHISAIVRRQHPEHASHNIELEINKLAEYDGEIQSLIEARTEPKKV